MATETTVTLPIMLRPREDGDGWRAEIQIGTAWAWGEGETRYAAVTDALHYVAWKMEDLRGSVGYLSASLSAEQADLAAWAEGTDDGD